MSASIKTGSMLSAALSGARATRCAVVPSTAAAAAAAALAQARLPLAARLQREHSAWLSRHDAGRHPPTAVRANSGGGAGGPSSSPQPQPLPPDPLLPPELAAHYRPNVAAVVVNADGKVFAARRVDDPNPDSLQFPQGGVDPGESPEEAAVRELYEETSMRSVALVGELPGWLTYDFPDFVRARLRPGWERYRGQAQKFYLFRFFGRDNEVDLATRHREFSHWRWVDLADMPGQVIDFKRGVYERVAAGFAPRIAELRASGELARRGAGSSGSGSGGGGWGRQ